MGKQELQKADYFEAQALFEEEYKAGYAEYLDGVPTEEDRSTNWCAGWKQAEAEEDGTKGRIVLPNRALNAQE